MSLKRPIVKILVWPLSIVLLLVLLALAIFRFTPQAYLALANAVTPYTISSSDLRTQLLPATIRFTNLKVTTSSPGQPVLKVGAATSLMAKVDYLGFLSSKHNFWYGEVAGGEIYIESLTKLEEPSAKLEEPSAKIEKPSAPQAKNPESSKLNIHTLLSMLNMKVSNSRIVFDQNTQLTISQLNTHISSAVQESAARVEQTIELALIYGQQNGQTQQKSLSLSGNLASKSNGGVSEIILNLNEIDLTSFLAEDPNEAHTAATAIDWNWLTWIEPIALAINADKITVDGGAIESANLTSKIDGLIEIEQLQGALTWALGEDLWLKDQLNVAGKFIPLDNGNLETSLSINASDSQWAIDGNINPLEPLKSQVTLELQATSLPLLDATLKPSVLLSENAQWLPLASKLNISPLISPLLENGSSATGFRIALQQLKAGESDISGALNITLPHAETTTSTPLSVSAQLRSKLLRYKSLEEPGAIAPSAEPSSDTKLFSSEPIDWSWMSSALAEVSIDIEALNVDQRALYNVSLPVTLNANGLLIDGAEAELGDGAIRASLKVTPSESSAVAIELNTRASGVVLNDLNLVDEATLKGGDTLLDLSLTSNGSSAHDLTSKLNGHTLFHLKKATIGNDAFELIGSDLVGELISKLNPFLKSDPSTDLKCAVVNLNINDGEIEIKKSIAMETSKMIIVADGKIDLGTEKIKLEIAPQSNGGIGLDAGSLVKFLELGGTLSNPKPVIGADGLLESGVAIGAALSTGGASLLVDGLVSKIGAGKSCERALRAREN